MGLQIHAQEERNKRRSEALIRVKHLDDLEDVKIQEEEEAKERRRCKGVIVEDDQKLEID